jgi:hypothetical protein
LKGNSSKKVSRHGIRGSLCAAPAQAPTKYCSRKKYPRVHIPDVKGVLADKYEAYDSDAIGELDLRVLLKQYGERRMADQLAANWHGGTYVAFKRAQVALSLTTGDVASLYVSHWKSEKAV